MAIRDDWLGNYFDRGIDIRRRRVFLHGDINEESASLAVQSIILLDDDSDKEITLYLSSLGGCVYEMFGLFDVIRNCRCHITGIAHGKIMSAAPLLLRATDDALAHPHTQFMNHEESWGDDRKGHSHQKVDMAHFDELETLWAKLMAKHTKLSAAAWAKQCAAGRDRYFGTEEALKWGLIDGIIQPDKKIRRA